MRSDSRAFDARSSLRGIAAFFIAMLALPGVAGAQAQAAARIGEALAKSIGDVSLFGDQYFAQLLQSQLTTLPVASSSGAFVYTFDPVSRTFARRTRSFGPTFLERASTLGRAHTFSLGVTLEPQRFTALDGRRLSESPLHSVQRYVDGRVVRHDVALTLSRVTTAVFGAYSVTPSVDVAVIVPVSRVSLRAVLSGDRRQFDSGPLTSTGLGDVEARAKWAAWRQQRVEVSAQFAIRLPTGATPVNGAGRAQQRLAGLVSMQAGTLQYHVNAGYVFRVAGKSPGESVAEGVLGSLTRGATSNEATYGAGVEWPPHPRVTLVAELIGRVMQDGVAFRMQTEDHTAPLYEGDTDLTHKFFFDRFAPVPTNLHIVSGVMGAKYLLVGNTVLTGHLLFPLTDAGLRPGLGAVVGGELGF